MIKSISRFLVFISVYLVCNTSILAKADSCWTVLVLKKGHDLKLKDDMRTISNSGFYLYRNVVYEVEVKSGQLIGGRLVDIKPDTLFFTTFFNATCAKKAGLPFDTIAVHSKNLSNIKLIQDRTMGMYSKFGLKSYDFIFEKDTGTCKLESYFVKIYENDSKLYEVVPHLTGQGMNFLYESYGRTYYYQGRGGYKPDLSEMDTSYDVRDFAWYTPCTVEKINGLAIGLQTENMKNSSFNEIDTLTVNGLSLQLNPFGLFSLMNPHLDGPYPDSLEFYEKSLKPQIDTKINGANISLTNTINEAHIKGINLTGLITVVDEIEGFTLSGISNFSYKLKGLSIAALYNHSAYARGLQIGLINKSSDLRGIQIGLWNKNGKRSLPFINWQFSESEKRKEANSE